MSKYDPKVIETIAALESYMDNLEYDLMQMGAFESEEGETNPGTEMREAAAEFREAVADGDEAAAKKAKGKLKTAAGKIKAKWDESPAAAKKALKIGAAVVGSLLVAGGVVKGVKGKKIENPTDLERAVVAIDFTNKMALKAGDEQASESIDPSYFAFMDACESTVEEEVAAESTEASLDEIFDACEAAMAELTDDIALEAAMEGEEPEGTDVNAAVKDLREAVKDGDERAAAGAIGEIETAVDEADQIKDPDKKKKYLKRALIGVAAVAALVGASVEGKKLHAALKDANVSGVKANLGAVKAHLGKRIKEGAAAAGSKVKGRKNMPAKED